MRRLVPLLLILACGAEGTVPDGEVTPLPTSEQEAAAAPPSRCTVTTTLANCAHQSLVIMAGGADRETHWQVPSGDAPANGWPAVLMFQGSFFSAQRTWAAERSDPFGALYQTLTVKRLLDSGFAVITPETRENGSSYWDSNLIAWSSNWEASPDARLMTELFLAIERGDFGPVDPTRLYATGISSGGYMTSRMALSYQGKFRALAVVSASWATCGGAFCAMPSKLPDGHPPTLFLHGKDDAIVPYKTMTDYEAQLRAEGFETSIVTGERLGHEWLPDSPGAVTGWFVSHP
jgi:poly(3-hydroxyoctanoate) depolymerase